MNNRQICYVFDENLILECDRLPAVVGRASMVHDLIEAYKLISHMKVVTSTPATHNDLLEFQDDKYLNHLKTFVEVDEDYMINSQDEMFGIAYDCPPVSNMYELVCTLAGGSITAARCLIFGIADIAINWCGGWHHGKRSKADGFCYLNDIVMAIEKLRKKFNKILYIDLDVHHGNGVEDVYSSSNSVFTLSFHKHEPGFYPGTGDLDSIGDLEGKGYTCNFPLQAAYSDETMEYAFDKVFTLVYNHFKPDAIVVQCGADALARDPNGGANLTEKSYCKCLDVVLDKRKPTLLLGGGGYNHANAARLWTTITAKVLGIELDDQIPEHSFWPKYGPDYTLALNSTWVKDNNKRENVDEAISKIKENLQEYLQPEPEQNEIENLKLKSLNKYKILQTKNVYKNQERKINPVNFDIYDFDE